MKKKKRKETDQLNFSVTKTKDQRFTEAKNKG